jgi:hypothetical protein
MIIEFFQIHQFLIVIEKADKNYTAYSPDLEANAVDEYFR